MNEIKLKCSDYMVQDLDPEEFDRTILHRRLFPVNMRLFKSSGIYRQVIMDAVNYMDQQLKVTYEDYSAPQGVSGANLGLPWNIIAFKLKGNIKFMINPVITSKSPEMIETFTNCGSLRLSEKIKVLRHRIIDVAYYDLKGHKCIETKISRMEGGFTIQHEVDHNLGITILDRNKEQTKVSNC
jgi:peptide deformylase